MISERRNVVIPIEELSSKVTGRQEYYYTKVQHHVLLATASNLIASLVFLAFELFLYFYITKNRYNYFPRKLDECQWSFPVIFFVLNVVLQVILVLGARKLNLSLLRLYLGLQGLLIVAEILILVWTMINLDAWLLNIARLIITLFSFWSFLAGLKMLKITIHERSDE
ncbi:unnamed protein product, partial [Mesorhabditis belari]|uniref:Uncharacterized protein n=1 Tax=Mesorhabditis belari TaxID=2138241 RepID=A0A915G4W4_9BILA